jgi:hypothetical protein
LIISEERTKVNAEIAMNVSKIIKKVGRYQVGRGGRKVQSRLLGI